MQSIATDVARSVVYVSVCLPTCWAHGWAVQKWLNQLRCLLGGDSCGSKEPCIRWWSRFPSGKGTFEGDICRPL